MKNIVVLVSGNGSNLQRIIDCTVSGEIPDTAVSLVVADRQCYGLERAEAHHIPTIIIPRGKSFSSELLRELPENTDLIVLAGFLSILSKEVCDLFKGKIINIHPALLPKYGGKGMWGHHLHQAVLESGEKESGATVHHVTSGIDEGEIIIQKSFEISEDDNLQTLMEKVHSVEQEIFPKAIQKVLNNSR